MRVQIQLEGATRSIHCRELGRGQLPLLHLHGGWGYEIYPLDRCLSALEERYRVLVPDRVGYGGSGRLAGPMPLDFHRRAADETLAVMDALGLDSAFLWGHSDGACTAAWMGLLAPERCRGIVLESIHFDRAKPSSVEFFRTMAREPREFGERVARVLAAEHGDDYWQELLRHEGRVWCEIRATPHPHGDLYDGRLGELAPPVLVLHGARDPRTEPDELHQVRAALPGATACVVEAGGHCPHSESSAWREATAAVVGFLDDVQAE